MTFKHRLAAFAILASCAGASAASAATPAWPQTIGGTWNGLSNQTQIVLTVSSQSTSGKCRSITGTIKDVPTNVTVNMLGYYCPNSGAVEFLRYPTNSNVAFQVYSGNLAQSPAAPNEGLLMSGSFGQYAPAYGPLGQYSFSLSR